MFRQFQTATIVVLLTVAAVQLHALYTDRKLDNLVQPLELGNPFPLSLVNLDDGYKFAFERCTTVILSNPACPACQELARTIGETGDGELHRRLVWVSFSDSAGSAEFASDFRLPTSIMKQIDQYERSRSRLYRLGLIGTPTRVIVDQNGTVRQIRITQEIPGEDELSQLCRGYDA